MAGPPIITHFSFILSSLSELLTLVVRNATAICMSCLALVDINNKCATVWLYASALSFLLLWSLSRPYGEKAVGCWRCCLSSDHLWELCNHILEIVYHQHGIEGRMYWDLMLLSMTNGKFCSLRSNFKQEIFEQFQDET